MALAMAAPSSAEALSFGDFSLPVGANAKGISAGDCDGDGTIDLIVANQNSNDVTTLRSNGNGLFEFGRTTEVASQPTGAACGDFTGDGLIDVAAVSRNGGTVNIYRRKEVGGFTLHGTRSIGLQPSALTAGHLNNDGHMDLVATNSKSNDISLLFGTGTSSLPLVSSRRIDAFDEPRSAAIGDFNGDDIPDIAVVGATDPFVVILVGPGFAPDASGVPTRFTGTQRPPKGLGVAANDLDGDGNDDLAILSSDSVVTLYLGVGDGSFSFLTAFSVPPGAASIAMTDADHDNLMDIALVYSSSNTVQVLRATAPATFPLPIPSAAEDSFNPLGLIAARTVLLDPADTSSTALQMVTLNGASRSLDLVEQTELTDLNVTPVLALTSEPQTVLLADMNNDTIPDAVVTSKVRRGSGIAILPGLPDGAYTPAADGAATCGNGVREGPELCDDGNTKNRDGCSKVCEPELKRGVLSMDAADVDADGNIDLVVVDRGGQLFVLSGDGQARFALVDRLMKVKKAAAAVVDFTGDGVVDIAVLPRRRRDGAILLLENDGSGNFTLIPILSSRRLRGPVLAGDFDRNGFVDLAVGERRGWTVFYNDGEGPRRDGGDVPAPRGLKALAAADFNEDGWLDIVATFKRKKNRPLIYDGTATGQYLAGEELAGTTTLSELFVVDIDQDLHQDIVDCDTSGGTVCRVMYGDGDGGFGDTPLPAIDAVGREVHGAGAGDCDQDGLTDVVGISRRDNRAVVMFPNFNRATPDRVVLDTGRRPGDMDLVDLDGDTLIDIVVANEGSKDVSVFRNIGARKFQTLAPVRLQNPSTGSSGLGAVSLALGDIDGNGLPDAAVTQAGSSSLTILINTGGGTLAVLDGYTTGSEPRGVAIGDLNMDDTLDIATANRGADTFSIFLSQPGGGYTRTDFPSNGIQPSAIALVDLDGDLYDDVIVTNEKVVSNLRLGNVVTFLNDQTGAFGAATLTHVRGRETPRSICVGDFDADTNADVAIASIDSSDVMVLLGNGDGTWRRDERSFPVGQDTVSVRCADADLDGRTDIAFGRKRAGDVGVILTGNQ